MALVVPLLSKKPFACHLATLSSPLKKIPKIVRKEVIKCSNDQLTLSTDTVSIIHHIYEVVETVELFLSKKTKNEKSELKEMETNGMIGITLNTY